MSARVHPDVRICNGRLRQVGAGFRIDKLSTLVAVFECECGSRIVQIVNNVKRGNSLSCGCLSKEIHRAIPITHGQSGSRTYQTWLAMISRCTNPKNDDFPDYGGRGILVCERWRLFDNFHNDVGDRPVGMSINRVNNNGNYEPGNVSWATALEQSRNRRSNRLVLWNGEERCFSDWELVLGFPEKTLSQRINRGWSIEDAMTIQIGVRRKKKT